MASHFIEIKKIPKLIFEKLLEDCKDGFFGGGYGMAEGLNYNDRKNNLILQAEKRLADKNSFAFINVEDNQHIRQLWIGRQIDNTFISEMVLFGKDLKNSKSYLYTDTDWISEFGSFLKENNINLHQSRFVKYSAFEEWIKFQLNVDDCNYEDCILEENTGPNGQLIIIYQKELTAPAGKSL